MSECICLGFSINKMCYRHGNPAKEIADQTAKKIADIYALRDEIQTLKAQLLEGNEALREFLTYYDSNMGEFDFEKVAELWVSKARDYCKKYGVE